MLVRELLEAEVVTGKFGKAHNPDIEVPKGYDSFFVKPVGKNFAIYGVKSDKSEHRISTTSSKELADGLAKEYNSGGKGGTGLKKMSLMQAFGSNELNAAHDAGISLYEKPTYWSDLTKDGKYRPLSDTELQKVKKAVGKIHEYEAMDVFDFWLNDDGSVEGNKKIVHGPLADKSPNFKPAGNMFIVDFADSFSDGKDTDKPYGRYLVDLTGASKYIRNWRKIGSHA